MKFEKIWNQNEHLLLSLIKKKVHNDVLCKDILQEVGIKLHQGLVQQYPIKNYQTWLFQVARYTIIDFYRKDEVHARLTTHDIPEGILEAPTITPLYKLSEFIIEHYLPKEYGTPLLLSDLEQIPQKEVAQRLGLTLTATKSRIQRARKKFKEAFSNFFEVEQNDKGQIVDYHLRMDVKQPQELLRELEKLKLF
ncbi:sigma-70 family RNA polymerase sigma factor [Microscilla marina]|uniref:RNA polymerase ECF-type sigma factor n=1 Tax=Microscilla marina ATCC 23134 TaxID=313606 RepID=A1ZNH3_MICM2|nr:sigma-70 family RNA polymerase sigma factor [Microscilla marina]EAY28084.1 RNA polymerase ECF-type sigma factor [Microscilla marina ATCC 23134]